jgi:hypothetical protein
LEAWDGKGSASPTLAIPDTPFAWGLMTGSSKSGPRPFKPPPGGLAVVAEEGAVADPFGMTPAVVSGVDDAPESMSIASGSPFSASSVKAWYLGREASDSSCVFDELFCGTEAFRAAFGLFVASDDRLCDVSFDSL